MTDVKRCISVGPFRDVAEAAHAASTLRSGGYDPRQRVADGDVWAGVWVYLPLPATRAASDQMLAKLKAAGIEDALEMPGPSDGSVISLGLYSESKRAQARVAQAQALGFNPAIADRKRTGNVYWIDIDLKPTDSVLKPSDLQGEAGRIVRLEVKGCPARRRAAAMTGRAIVLRITSVLGASDRLRVLRGVLVPDRSAGVSVVSGRRVAAHRHERGIARRPRALLHEGRRPGRLAALAHWLEAPPVDWLGLHRVLEVVPASLALFALSIVGNCIFIYGLDRIAELKRNGSAAV